MMCDACVGHIERALRALEGVEEARADLATNTATITRNPAIATEALIKAAIEEEGYEVGPEERCLAPGQPNPQNPNEANPGAWHPGKGEQNPTTQQLTLQIQGMTCAACVGHVERALTNTEGVSKAQVNLLANEAKITFNPNKTTEAQLKQAIEDAGYKAEQQTTPDEYPTTRRHAIISLTLGAIIMASMPFAGHENTYPQLLAALFVMAVPGREYYIRAAQGLKHNRFDMSTLIAVGTGSAFFYSLAATLLPHQFHARGLMPDVYYEAVIFIIALVLTGKMFELRARRETASALRELAQLQPATALIIRNNEPIETPIELVKSNDVALIKPGTRIPVDGVILTGRSAIDESMLTGEPIPVEKEPGHPLSAGTINGTGALQIKVTAVGPATVLSQIGRMMREAQSTRAPMQKLADKVSAIFVPTVLVIALLTLLTWLAQGADPGRALSAAVAVLIIACPCAMGLAIPAAVMVATGQAAKLGVLIKGGEALERLAQIQTVVLDKTGTITEGRPTVTRYTGTPEDLPLIASLEAASEHPLAQAIVRYANTTPLPVTNFQAEPGQGATGTINGHTVKVGRPAWVGSTDDATIAATIDNRPAGAFDVNDPIRPTSKAAIETLHQLGLEVAMLTGDRQATANQIAKEAGITQVTAGVLPGGKRDAIRAYQANGRKVAMVGDGINDAPALAQSDAAISMASGSGIAVEAGEITLLRNDLTAVADAIRLSRLTVRIMRQNLFWAFCYNAAGIPIAALGLLNPIFASAAMAFSSFSVLANSLRLRRFQ